MTWQKEVGEAGVRLNHLAKDAVDALDQLWIARNAMWEDLEDTHNSISTAINLLLSVTARLQQTSKDLLKFASTNDR